MKLHPTRPAVAMIELIFAIAVMGIALMSAPMLVNVASTSSQATFQQESIAMIASHTNALLTYAWDEGDTESVSNYNILDTDSPNAQLDVARRAISNPANSKLRILPSPPLVLAASSSGDFGAAADSDLDSDGNADPDDVDDFHGADTALVTIDAVTNVIDGNYIDRNININTLVRYIGDEASSADFATCQNAGDGCAFSKPVIPAIVAGSSNVKLIETTLTSTNVVDKVITLRAFMCNIGTALPRRREGI